MSLLNVFPRLVAVEDEEFQSLFSWMSLLNDFVAGPADRYFGVSILVLVDVALELAARDRDGPQDLVSILVLVDVALELCSFSFVIQMIQSFNPCSRGCRS